MTTGHRHIASRKLRTDALRVIFNVPIVGCGRRDASI